MDQERIPLPDISDVFWHNYPLIKVDTMTKYTFAPTPLSVEFICQNEILHEFSFDEENSLDFTDDFFCLYNTLPKKECYLRTKTDTPEAPSLTIKNINTIKK